MPTDDLDNPLHPTAERIRKREFSTVRRGYHPQEVRAYLISIADQVGSMEEELRRSRLDVGSETGKSEHEANAATAAQSDDPYDALSKRFATLIEMADQEAKKTIEEARSEAIRELEEARKEADRIKVDAQAHAEVTRHEVSDLLDHATTKADRVLSRLAERRRSLEMQLEEMRGKLIAVAEDLAVPIDEGEPDALEDDEPADRRDDESGREQTEAPGAPRYEDLWGLKDEPIQLPDLASLDLDVKERDE
jgi:DivIVA domain-containing protein